MKKIICFVSQKKFNGTNRKQAPAFVLLGNPAYGRWFLDGSDPDVRLVAVIHITGDPDVVRMCQTNILIFTWTK